MEENIGSKFSEIKELLSNRKTVISLIIIIILILGLAVGLYLVKNPQILKSRATEKKEAVQQEELSFGIKAQLLALYDTNNDGQIDVQEAAKAVFSRSSQSLKSKGFIIEFKDPPLSELDKRAMKVPLQEVLSRHETAKRDVLEKLGRVGPLGKTLLGEYTKVFNGVALDITEEEAQKVKKSNFVKKIYPNYKVKATLDSSSGLIKAPDAWNLTDSQGNNLTGRDIKIGIIDTGIDYTHPDLGGCSTQQVQDGGCSKVIGGYDFINEDNDPIDDHFHGTHVAGIAAGNGTLANGQQIKGIAPDAKIVAYKVLDNEGNGSQALVMSAIERSSDPNQDGDFSDHLDVINLSLGAPGSPDDPVSLAIDRAADKGVVAVIAAGNSGPDEATVGSPGVARKALTVGANDKDNKLAYFSSRGPVLFAPGSDYNLLKPDVTAPGVGICAAELGEILSSRRCLDGRHISISGTSMAAPHVAGVAALVKQAHPLWSAEEIKNAIITTTTDLGLSSIILGNGEVNALKAVQATLNISPASLSFGMVDGVQNSWTTSKNLTIKNTKEVTASYTLSLKQTANGALITFSENSFALASGESKTLKIDLVVDNNTFSEGMYSSEIQIVEGENIYRVPVMFFKKNLQVIVEPNPSSKYFTAKVVTPYVSLTDSPTLEMASPLGNKTTIPLFIKNSFLLGDDLQTWVSSEIEVSESGDYLLSATTGIAGYNAQATLNADLTRPNFQLNVTPDNNYLNLRITSDKEINQGFAKTYPSYSSDNGDMFPSIHSEGANVYTVYSHQRMVAGGYSRTLNFAKSSDAGMSWSNTTPILSLQDIALSSITKFNGKLFVVFVESGQGRKLKLISSDNDGETWTTPIILDENVDDQGYLSLAIKQGKGRLHVIYTHGRSLSMALRYIKSDGVNWSRPKDITRGAFITGGDISIEKDILRVGYLLEKREGEVRDKGVYFAGSLDEGDTWDIKKIDTLTLNAAYLSIVSSEDKIFLVWGLGNGKLQLGRSFDGGRSWEIKNNVTASNSLEMAPRLGYTDGKLFLMWLRNIYGGIFLRISDDQGGSWQETPLDESTTFVGSMATSGNNVNLVWSTSPALGGPMNIASARNGEAVAKVSYKTESELINLSKAGSFWEGKASLSGNGIYSIEIIGRSIDGSVGKLNTSYPIYSVCTPCMADIVKDDGNRVDAKDSALFSSCTGKRSTENNQSGQSCSVADVNSDGIVDQKDQTCLQSQYFKTCVLPTPSPPVVLLPTPTPTPTPAPTLPPSRVFITSTSYAADFGGLTQADTICQESANSANLGGIWKAWLSDSKISAASRLTHSTSPYVLLDGTVIASNWNDLTDGTLFASISLTETKRQSEGVIWTNTNFDGTIVQTDAANTCDDWKSKERTKKSVVGSGLSIDPHWSNLGGLDRCNEFQSGLYCFEQFSTPTPFVCSACAADIVKSARNRVDAQDNALLSSCFGKDPATTLPGGRSCTPADINKDGSVNQADVDCLKSVYFQTCTATGSGNN
ncbi:S8 family serine peptidase [Candidatus Daviesbacteria bacterium]|nr:S8 family serine peptidase [Candidatus Daviesbacteria bacterium]